MHQRGVAERVSPDPRKQLVSESRCGVVCVFVFVNSRQSCFRRILPCMVLLDPVLVVTFHNLEHIPQNAFGIPLVGVGLTCNYAHISPSDAHTRDSSDDVTWLALY